MTIEITRGKSTFTYRQNPYSPTEIDRRTNRHNARWFFFRRFATAEEAMAALLQLSDEDKDNDR